MRELPQAWKENEIPQAGMFCGQKVFLNRRGDVMKCADCSFFPLIYKGVRDTEL